MLTLFLHLAGQRYDGETSWTAFLRHMGANGARLFGMNGLLTGQTLPVVLTNSAPDQNNAAQLQSYGNDFTNTPVTSLATFNTAVAALRKSDFSGRNVSNTALTYAAPWATVYSNFATVDNATADTQSQGSPKANMAALTKLGVQPLAVHWLSCTDLNWQSLSPSATIYWGERWEVYKYQYVLAYWAYQNGVKRIEYWNEPDLSATCINGAQTTNAVAPCAHACPDTHLRAGCHSQAPRGWSTWRCAAWPSSTPTRMPTRM